jgi:pimeloyl-ACP methyl ester carboxylesterase
LTIPVLALGGEFGMNMIPFNDLKAVAENVRGGIVEDCGHYIAEEQPEELTRQLLEFFKTEEQTANE